MALALEIIKNLSGFSIAKYSTWFYYKPDHILFDAGEGISVSMRNMIYGIKYVFLTHGHGDHIAGLPGLLRSRASSMGDKAKPLQIFYPQGDRNIAHLQQYLKDSVGRLPFDVNWEELRGGERIPLAACRSIEAFPSNHTNGTITLGYRILEHRVRLMPCYRRLPQAELMELIKNQGKQRLSESYDHALLCFSGDSMPLSVATIANCEVLLHDATFLTEEDRDDDTHATVDEVLQLASQAEVAALGLFHFSARYRHQQILEKIQQAMRLYKINIPVFYIFSHFIPLSFKKVN